MKISPEILLTHVSDQPTLFLSGNQLLDFQWLEV
jgi:hypothetical protein